FETHLKSLRRSLDALETLYPGLPLALVNDLPGAVLAQPNDFLELLEAAPNLRFVFNTGLAYHAVDHNPETYGWLLRSLGRFEARLPRSSGATVRPGRGSTGPSTCCWSGDWTCPGRYGRSDVTRRSYTSSERSGATWRPWPASAGRSTTAPATEPRT